jgi:acyl-CoA reductase-like NAD-dependent aldehyde dehydrogenase
MSSPTILETPTDKTTADRIDRAPLRAAPDTDVAGEVARARRAQAAWAARSLDERLAIIRRARQRLPMVAAQWDRLIHPQRRGPGETLGLEVVPTADAFRFLERYAAKVLKPRRYGAWLRPVWLMGVVAEVHREPFGVILVIGPSNYPLFLPAVQAIQALAAGNSVVLKPGTGGGPIAEAFAELMYGAGLDPDLLRVLSESPEAAERAIEAGVDKVLLTGSARTGAAVLAKLAPRLIPATLELSGCDAVFVREDANLDVVTRALRFGFRLNHGETCIAPHRVFVARPLADDLKKRLANAAELECYESRTPAARAAAGLISDATRRGARVLAGKILADQQGITPTVVADVSPDMPLLQEDLFAPVVSVVEVSNDDEALAAAAKCPYGLGSTVFGGLAGAQALAQRIHAGGVVINDMVAPTADPRLPFGGRGRSGYGVTRGVDGLLEVTTVKVVSTRKGGADFHLDPPQANDYQFFETYLRATNSSSFTGWLSAWRSLIPLMIQRLRGPATPPPVDGQDARK